MGDEYHLLVAPLGPAASFNSSGPFQYKTPRTDAGGCGACGTLDRGPQSSSTQLPLLHDRPPSIFYYPNYTPHRRFLVLCAKSLSFAAIAALYAGSFNFAPRRT